MEQTTSPVVIEGPEQIGEGNCYGELLADVADLATRWFAAEGVEVQEASRRGFRLAEHLREHWQGTQIYIPAEKRIELSVRDTRIVEEFVGDNWLEICRKYGISRGRIYQIVREARQHGVTKTLPGFAEDPR